MLDQIDVNKTVDKETYRAARENLGAELGKLQRELKEEKIPVMIVFDGLDAAGKGLQINRMIQALDPRGYEVYAAREATEDEVMRPFLWRYWTKTPEAGKIAIYDRSWYHRVNVERFEDEPDERELAEAFKDINSFERQLTDGGAVIIKFFLLISKKEQKKRFKKLKDSRETRWRVSAGDEARNEHYGRYLAYNEEMLEKTDTDFAPWTIVEAEDKDYAALKILIETVRQFKEALEAKRAAAGKKTAEITELAPLKNGVLSGVDLAKTMDRETYKKEMDRLKKRLEFLHSEIYRLRFPWCSASRAGTPRERAGPSAGSPATWTPGATRWFPPPRPTIWRRPTTTSGVSGTRCRRPATSPSSTAPGTAVSWWSASRASAPARSGGGLTARSTRWRPTWPISAL